MQAAFPVYKHAGATSNIIHVFISTSAATTGVGLTGLVYNSASLVITAVKPGDASATVYSTTGNTIEDISTLGTFAAPTATKCRFKEYDATNMPGWYEIHLADALFTTAGTLNVHVQGATNVRPATVSVIITTVSLNKSDGYINADVQEWLGTAVTTSSTTNKPEVDTFSISNDSTAANNAELMFDGTGYAGGTTKLDVNVAQISTDATAADNCEAMFDGTGYAGGTIKLGVDVVAISGDTTAADNAELMFDGTGYAGGTAKLGVDVVQISGDSTAADKLEAMYEGTLTGNISDASPAVGDFDGDAGLSATNDAYNGCYLHFRSGPNAGISRKISDYNGTSKNLSFTGTTNAADGPFPFVPTNGDTFIIIGRHGA